MQESMLDSDVIKVVAKCADSDFITMSSVNEFLDTLQDELSEIVHQPVKTDQS